LNFPRFPRGVSESSKKFSSWRFFPLEWNDELEKSKRAENFFRADERTEQSWNQRWKFNLDERAQRSES